MKKYIITLILSLLVSFAYAQKDDFVGFYKGTQIEGGKSYPLNHSNDLYGEVYLGPNGYKFKLVTKILSNSETYWMTNIPNPVNGIIILKNVGDSKLNGTITPKRIELSGIFKKDTIKILLEKFDFISPTLGLKSPTNAKILFDGNDMSNFQNLKGEKCGWNIVDNSMVGTLMMSGGKKIKSDILTKESFEGPFKLHLEFKIPAKYSDAGWRGNSGIYIGDFEIQVLDSFGGGNSWMECGAIYRMHAPKSNACLEPETWQTYDIEYFPPKFNGEKLTEYPCITVFLNGIRIHNKEPLYWATELGEEKAKNYNHSNSPVKILLQYHGYKVAFRNIWIEKL